MQISSLKAQAGVTLLEMALAMMIVAVLSIGVSGLITTGVQTQMSESMNQHLQSVSNLIVDDLRHDFREADTVSVTNNGNTLTLFSSNPSGNENIVYSLAGGNLSRVRNGGTQKIYNDPKMYKNLLEVVCPGGQVTPGGPSVSGCFAFSANARQVVLPNLQVQAKVSNGTVIDKHFGKPNYTVRNFAFDVMSATEFQ